MNAWDEIVDGRPRLPGLPRSRARFMLILSVMLAMFVCLVLLSYQEIRLRKLEKVIRALSSQQQEQVQQLVQVLLSDTQRGTFPGDLATAIPRTKDVPAKTSK